MVTGLSHVSIAVPDLEAAARQLNDKYGLRVGARMVNAEQGVRLAYVELGAAKIELIAEQRHEDQTRRADRGQLPHEEAGLHGGRRDQTRGQRARAHRSG